MSEIELAAQLELELGTYLSTIGMVGERTVASSLSRWGRLPVFSSCSMTPTTIVSSMPWVSTFVCLDSPPGDGGGVSATRPWLFGRSSKRSVAGRGGEAGVEAEELECDRFCFFAMCCVSGFEGGERADRGAPGTAMPSN